MYISEDIKYIGVDDHKTDLFEGQYPVPKGMAYNSYAILDEKIAVIDTVDVKFGAEWLFRVMDVLGDRKPDYLIIQHMEPDHSANIADFMQLYKETKIVSSEKAFKMMKQFFGTDFSERAIVVKEGDTLCLGRHTLAFVEAPMVHWPEVFVTYDACDKVLFSADGSGKFGANDVEDDWDDEARRYYIGIVGQYGPQVQTLLKKAANLKLEIQIIAPTHGPVLRGDLSHYLKLYDQWSSYTPEEEGIVIAYTSVYGHTKEAIEILESTLKKMKCPKVVVYDLARDDMSKALADAFRYNKLVLATTTYNAGMYPFMHDFIHRLVEHKFQKRTVAFVENGSWSPQAARLMKEMLAGCPDLLFTKNTVHIHSALDEKSAKELVDMASELCCEYLAQNEETADKNNLTALFKIGYGLYVVTSRDEKNGKDNGCIVNAVTQLTNTPNRVAVTINKANLSHDLVKDSGKLNVNCLSVDAPFSVFQNFGFQSGRNTDKFADWPILYSDNGLAFLPKYINAFLSLKVEQYVDMGTHGMFICSITEARVMNQRPTMTYDYYQNNVKPKPQTGKKKGFVCKVCGYIYEGEELPADFICPICKHGAADFEPLS
ncbi:MAG: flavin reductase [Lachnospiraceae bacterium]|nr:flavin reductase [Lachnospiraceae bacterium]